MSTSAPQLTVCAYCGGIYHRPERCPQVCAIEYHRDGSIKRVELGSRFQQQTVVYPPPAPPMIGPYQRPGNYMRAGGSHPDE